MTQRILISLLLVAFLAPLLSGAVEEAGPKTIEDHMEVINDNYKALRRTARRKAFDEKSIEQAGLMIENAKKARELEPPMAARFQGEEKKKFIEDFRKEIDTLIETFTKLETLLKEKKADEAVALLDTFDELKKKGHEKFVEE